MQRREKEKEIKRERENRWSINSCDIFVFYSSIFRSKFSIHRSILIESNISIVGKNEPFIFDFRLDRYFILVLISSGYLSIQIRLVGVRRPISSSKLIMHRICAILTRSIKIHFRISFPSSLRHFRPDRLINRNYAAGEIEPSQQFEQCIAFTNIIRCLLREAVLPSLSLSLPLSLSFSRISTDELIAFRPSDLCTLSLQIWIIYFIYPITIS